MKEFIKRNKFFIAITLINLVVISLMIIRKDFEALPLGILNVFLAMLTLEL